MKWTGAWLCIAALAALAGGVAADELVRNGDFEQGGRTWCAHWRPTGGEVRVRRVVEHEDASLRLILRGDGDGGVVQVVDMPANAKLSLRLLATAWDTPGGGVVAGLIRQSDGAVLCEMMVGGIERGEISRNFQTGAGGPAELTLRLVGPKGGQGAVERVRIAAPVAACADTTVAFGAPEADLVLAPGEGLRFEGSAAAQGAQAVMEMVAEAVDDLATVPPTVAGKTVSVHVAGGPGHWPQTEAYRLRVSDEGVNVEAGGEAGVRWALMTLVDLMRSDDDGGVRVMAAESEDAPDLPWRGAWAAGPDSQATNLVRKLARLKMNVALVPATTTSQGEDDWEVVGRDACEEALRHGLEPVAALLSKQATASGMQVAAETVARNLPVDYLMVAYPGGWDSEVGEAVLAGAAQAGRPITVICKLDVDSVTTEQAAAKLAAWPTEVIALVGSECVGVPELADALGKAAERGVTYLLGVEGAAGPGAQAALSARLAGRNCLGVLALGDDPEAVANAAWQVPR